MFTIDKEEPSRTQLAGGFMAEELAHLAGLEDVTTFTLHGVVVKGEHLSWTEWARFIVPQLEKAMNAGDWSDGLPVTELGAQIARACDALEAA